MRRDGGPSAPVAARPGVGATSLEAWRLDVDAGAGLVRADLPVATGHPVDVLDQLSWQVCPVGADAPFDSLWDATAVALDVQFDDGGWLTDLPEAVDQYGGRLGPDDQAAAERLWVDQWNLRTVDLGPCAGRRVQRVVVTARASAARDLVVFVDDVGIAPRPVEPATPLDHVRTTRGTQSSGRFSRGNTAPHVSVPHGGVLGLPTTDATKSDWPYSWHEHNRASDNRPTLQAFATSHLPSPWMGDRGVFQVMPSPSAQPDVSPTGRALGFDHADEVDWPHLYRVRLDGGVDAALTAGDFALGMRFSFAGPTSSVVLDHHGTVADVSLVREGDDLVVDLVLDDRPETPPHFVHLRVGPATHDDPREHLTVRSGRLRGWVVVDASSGPVDVLLGISTVGRDEARVNLAAAGGFDEMGAEAERRWAEALDTVEVRGATLDQRVSLYSGLARLFSFPTRHGESPAGGPARSRSPYGSVLSSPIRDAAPGAEAGPGAGAGAVAAAEVVVGPYSSTNGFWDTYRTAWPLLGLLTPSSAGALAQGFVQHHLDGGWTPRWSAPGAEDVMTGTTSDTVFADLLVKGVPGLDLEQAYASAVTNATVPPTDRRVGRKGLHPGLFRGWVDTDTPEGMSWTLDAAINDWSTSRLAALVAARHEPGTPEHERASAEAEWFARRSAQYRTVFDRARGFFVGRRPDGGWRVPAESFDPAEWGHDYTETNAWGTAFTVPHDGAGLAELHGGEEALGAALDRFFAQPETGAASLSGSYGFAIHEMTEARDVRRGMLGLSNQPAHHIPFMYAFAGRHDDAHRVVRDALDRLFVGSDLGQGYPGDEDNGEMSAWWIFATIGLYPLVPASGSYLLLPPAVERTVLRPQGGPPITLVVTNPDEGGRFVRRVLVDGVEWHDVSIDHARLVAGATIEFELSTTPCGWAAASRPFSASQQHGHRREIRDATAGGRASGVRHAAALVDDEAARPVRVAAGQAVELDFATPVASVGLYTVTVEEPGAFSWTLEALDGGGAASTSAGVDHREEEVFDRPGQTRVFRAPVVSPPASPGAAPGADADVHGVRLTAVGDLRLLQVEVLG
ncbi:glycoside hydrolase family 92 protein [Frigoribacterium sp. ACAM 257]|nr:glycoside hydrolase family 92 protein [Frigoribacterium sp. ACAM 257]